MPSVMRRIKTLAIHAKGEVYFSPPEVDCESRQPPVSSVMLATEAGNPPELRASTVAKYPEGASPQDYLAVQRIRPKTHNKTLHGTPRSVLREFESL
jgi:hypothetical protein